MEEQPEIDALVAFQRDAIKKAKERYGDLAEFSPEQMGDGSETMGTVFVPQPDFKGYQKFSNLKARHLKALFWSYWMKEVREAAVNRRRFEFEKVIANFEKGLADVNGWSANMYLRTGLEALRANPMPGQKIGYWERRRMKKQGGW